MKNTKKAFTLVELIVVITILAVLATVAFISLTGYSQDSKNSKVASDVRSLITAIEAGNAKGDFTIKDIVGTSDATNYGIADVANSGAITLAGAAIAGTYDVGTIDFATIKQQGDDFTDGENPYLVAYVSSGSFAGYNVAGQTKNDAGTALAYVSGNYIQVQTTDAESLISQNGNTNQNPIVDEQGFQTPANDLYGN